MDLLGLQRRIGNTLYLTDHDVLTALHGTLLANQAAREPVWLVLIGAPATGKTQLATPLEILPGVRLLNDISEKTFLSGLTMGKRGNQSLLPKLTAAGVYQLINLDFGNVFSKSPWVLEGILSQMRQIYDGQLTLDRGSGDSISWKGFMGFIGCATPTIYSHQQTISNLGDRFLFIRMDAPPGDEALDRALDNLDSYPSVTEAIKVEYRAYHETRRDPLMVTLSEGSKRFLKQKAALLARIRAHVRWDKNNEIAEEPFFESPTRIIRSGAMLLRGIAAANDDMVTAPEHERIIERIFLDTAPPARIRVLQTISKEPLEATVVSRRTGLGRSGCHGRLQELQALGLASKNKNNLWEPTQIAYDGLSNSKNNVVKFGG